MRKDVLLQNTKKPVSFAEFKAFVESEHDEDNLLFWLAVEDYKTAYLILNSEAMMPIESSNKLLDMMCVLRDSYIKVGSAKELNLSSSMRKQTLEGIEL